MIVFLVFSYTFKAEILLVLIFAGFNVADVDLYSSSAAAYDIVGEGPLIELR